MKADRVQLVDIDSETEGQRLDNFLIRHLKGLPKSRIYRIIRKGEVRVNGRRAKPLQRLISGDQVRVPPIKHLVERSEAVGSFQDVDSLILYEDKHLFIINKPAGMAVHGGSGVKAGVIESLRHLYPAEKNLELVHRLDRGTSGCLMVAKKRSYLRLLQDALRKPGQISKQYMAVVHGQWPASLHKIDEPLLTSSKTGQERFTRVDPGGKTALTRFSVLATEQDISVVQASPMTGRTHQIRVHARWARHPIVGDDRYGDQARDQLLSRNPKRMLLHARELRIPSLGERPALEVIAPLDQRFARFLENTLDERLDIL